MTKISYAYRPKTMLLYNHHALKRKPRHRSEEVADALRAVGIDPVIVSPTKIGNAIELVENAVLDGFERIISTGGDGTVNEVVNGIVRAQRKGAPRPTLGILPNGRGNDFGFAVGIPQNLKRAVEIIAAGNVQRTDVGLVFDGVSERYFINGAGVGIDAAINYWATRSRLNGFASYLWGLGEAIAKNYVQPRMKIRIDDLELETQVLMLGAMNGRREGGGFDLAPDFDLQDGLLNVTLVGDGLPVAKVLPIVPKILKGRVDDCAGVLHRYRAKRISAEISGAGVIGQADGEILHTGIRSFRAEISDETVDLLVPEKDR